MEKITKFYSKFNIDDSQPGTIVESPFTIETRTEVLGNFKDHGKKSPLLQTEKLNQYYEKNNIFGYRWSFEFRYL